ncbi:MAG: DUF305 domain-containing protein [Oscillospiraceae bacterium]|nr:DUF305 domain-containing protein [Oscillospiraceae bacterium]
MANTYLLSDPSKRYLCCYYQILDEMIQGITTAKLTRSLSHNFIVQMIPHHQAAVRMCRNLLQYSDDGAVRRLAQRITDQQTQGLQAMEGLLPDCGQPANPQMDLRLCHRRTELILRELFSQMGSAPEGNRLDLVFLRQMIPHHLGAARMAQNTLRYQVATGLAPVLRSTIDTHCKEVRQMRALLRRMGCQTV